MANSERPAMADVYSRVTDKIIADLETGVAPWHKPWSAGNASGRIAIPTRITGEHYRGINVLMLWGAAQDAGYERSQWLTFKQAIALKGCVRKGEKGTLVVYASTFSKTETDANGDDTERAIPFLKGYTVFNVAQCDGLPARYYGEDEAVTPLAPVAERCAAAETFVGNTGAIVRHGGGRAFYSTGTDAITMPPYETFEDPESYAATKLHELGHWTGHEKRLARTFGKHFGDKDYSKEELVAELTAAFLCADLNVSGTQRKDHSEYIRYWLDILKEDKRAIFKAASAAQKAADYLHNMQPAIAELDLAEAAD
jgi:antirestriction protein ArdC